MVKNFRLSQNQQLSKQCIAKGLTNFNSLFKFVKQLPYGRNSNRSHYALILKENKGTCSTKHAFLQAIVIENNSKDLVLYLGIFKMDGINTPKIKSILEKHHLNYIPEAHCYLKCHNKIVDITFKDSNEPLFSKSIIHEEIINPEQIGTYKFKFHKDFIRSWIISENLKLSFDELWNIRESCILELSE